MSSSELEEDKRWLTEEQYTAWVEKNDELAAEAVAAEAVAAEAVSTAYKPSLSARLPHRLVAAEAVSAAQEHVEIKKYLETFKKEIFKNVCFIPNHSLLIYDIKKNIKLLSKEKVANNHTLLKFILNIQFNILKEPSQLLELSKEQYHFKNMSAIILLLLNIDSVNTPFTLINNLFQNKFQLDRPQDILIEYIKRHLYNFIESTKVKRIKEENIKIMNKELESKNLKRLRGNRSELQKIELVKSLNLRPYTPEELSEINEYNDIINTYISSIAAEVIPYYEEEYKDIFFENLIILDDLDKEFINTKVYNYIVTKFDKSNSFENPFPNDKTYDITENIFYISKEKITSSDFSFNSTLFEKISDFIKDLLTNENIKKIFIENEEKMIRELIDEKFRLVHNLGEYIRMIKIKNPSFSDIKLLNEYNQIIVKYQKIIVENIHSMLDWNKLFYKESISIIDKDKIKNKLRSYLKQLLDYTKEDNKVLEELIKNKFTDFNPPDDPNIFFDLHEYLEDKCRYEALKFELNYTGILRTLVCTSNKFNFINLDHLNLREIKKKFIFQFLTLLKNIMTQQQQKQQPNIVTYLFNISNQYDLGLNAIDDKNLDENLANIKNDLDNLKKILEPIFNQIQNPIYYLLEEIKKNKDTSLNGYILFINYILNEINLLINTRVIEFYGNFIKTNPEYVEFIESSKINKYIKGTYDYTELFKEKDINTEYLFLLFEDILYKTIKPYLKKKIEERAAEAAEVAAAAAKAAAKAAAEEAALTPKERALRKEQREREKEEAAAQEAAAIAEAVAAEVAEAEAVRRALAAKPARI